MKLSTREDIAVPIEAVFASVTNFEEFERRALRRGAEISRSDPPSGAGLGSAWDVAFMFRGRDRKLRAEVVGYDAPEKLTVASQSGGLHGSFTVSLVALSPRKTRMVVGLELVPKNLSARLLVQSFKLAKASIKKRYDGAVLDYAHMVEDAYKSSPAGRRMG
ncbi:MAG: SRPBCC family protein [Pseudomonadota bacterium]